MNLRDIPLFMSLEKEDIKLVEKNIKIEEKFYKKGSYIFNQGEVKKDLYFLEKGSILVAKFDANGKRSIIQSFSHKAIFGEIYAYLEEPYDFSALAQEDSTIIQIKKFKNLINEKMPKVFLRSFIDLIARKCLVLSQKNQINTQFTLRQKIANYLIYKEENNEVDLELTREELADFLSTTRPSLSRELSKMREEKIIRVRGKKIQILDREKIRDLSY